MTAVVRIALSCLLAVPASAVLVPLTVEPGLSGTYEELGNGVAGVSGPAPGEFSFNALLNLEFDPLLAQAFRGQTSRIVVTQTEDALQILAYDLDGNVSKKGEWKLGQGYTREGGRALLRLRATLTAREEYLLILQSVSQGKLLQIEVHRITPTTFGPAYRVVGTYVFARMP